MTVPASDLEEPAQPHRAYIARETLVSVVISIAISAFFTWLVFGGAAAAARADIIVDYLPQTFMVALMGSLVPTALTRKRVSGGVVARLNRPAPKPRNLVLRSLIFALAATLILGGLAAGLTLALGPDRLAFPALLALKCLYGGIVALAVTPLAVRMALSDDQVEIR